jgi:sulfide dehydrogenase cytochrome subunit
MICRRRKFSARRNVKHTIYAASFVLICLNAAQAQSPAPAGAAACSGCHAPAAPGSPVPPLAGRNADEIIAAMQDFRSGKREATIMNRIAKGFSDDETRTIAVWFSAQH